MSGSRTNHGRCEAHRDGGGANGRPGRALFIALTLIATIVLGAASGALSDTASPPAMLTPGKSATSAATFAKDSENNKRRFLKYLWPILKSNRMAARVYYEAKCDPGSQYLMDFPPIDMRSPGQGLTGIEAIRSLFAENIHVEGSRHDIVRITIGSVQTSILSTKISSVRWSPIGQYNPELAALTPQGAPEVKSEMSRLKIQSPSVYMNIILAQPAPGLIHLPTSITDVTMDRALDLVATTFHGIVLYGTCQKEGIFMTNFIGGIYFDDRWLDTAN